jgi:sterol desaturase/sphingolipid hydroxylase (fatty acid hydroxylase superfamily)
VKKTAKWVAFNCIFLNCLLALSDSYFTDYKYSMEEIPEVKTLIWQFVFFLFVEDFFLYVGHSSMHRP